MDPRIAQLRKEYRLAELDEASAGSSPFLLFSRWFDDALRAQLPEPNAMAIATATCEGDPSLRMVLMKKFDPEGVLFFTNYESRKGRDLAVNPRAALLFYWAELERQVRINGAVERVSAQESDGYFAERPRGSQLSAATSPQSAVIATREELEQRRAELDRQLSGQKVPRPPFWGGYRLRPERFEFWQGREDRLHDRIEFRLAHGTWQVVRLAP